MASVLKILPISKFSKGFTILAVPIAVNSTKLPGEMYKENMDKALQNLSFLFWS